MACSTLILNDADEISAYLLHETGMQAGYLQLSRGAANLKYQAVDLGGVSILWASTEADALWRDKGPESGLHFGCALESERSVCVDGTDVERGDAAIWMPGQEIEIVQLGRSLTLEVGVSPALVNELGWSFSGSPLRRIPLAKLHRLVSVCRNATDQAMRFATDIATIAHCREHVLEALEPALEPWIEDAVDAIPPLRRACECIVHKADYIYSNSPDAAVTMDELADKLGVPRRTLFHKFKKTLGIGPRRYFELKRLHQLRRCLQDAEPRSDTITRIATEHGFSDPGRLARLYYEHFGEMPSKTLRRIG